MQNVRTSKEPTSCPEHEQLKLLPWSPIARARQQRTTGPDARQPKDAKRTCNRHTLYNHSGIGLQPEKTWATCQQEFSGNVLLSIGWLIKRVCLFMHNHPGGH